MQNAVFLGSTILSLFGLVYLIFWLYPAYCIDSYRQQMFELRDELFDFAESGRISFDHPAYGQLRYMINGFIRFAHQLSPWLMLFGWIFTRKTSLSSFFKFEEKWKVLIGDLPADVLVDIEKFRLKMHVLVAKHALRVQPEWLILFGLVFLVLSVVVSYQKAKDLILAKVKIVDPAALSVGKDSDSSSFLRPL